MRSSGWAYVVIAGFAAVGCVLLLLDRAAYDAADAFRAAVECPDDGSDHCYQMYPGVIQAVRSFKTADGEEDRLAISSRGESLSLKVYPSAAEARSLQPGRDLTVQWYTGNVMNVWVDGHAIPTSFNFATRHANLAYVGGLLVWIAAVFAGAVVLYAQLVAAVRRVIKRAAEAKKRDLQPAETVLPPGDTGWLIRPRVQELYVLPLLFIVLMLVSIRPFMNADTRWLAVVSDLVLFGLIFTRLALTLRNERLAIGRNSLSRTDWLGRTQSWDLDDLEVVSVVAQRLYDVGIPVILFIGRDGTVLTAASSFFWDVGEIARACNAVGYDLAVGVLPPVRPRLNWKARTAELAVFGVTMVLFAMAFYPLPPMNIVQSP